MARYQVYDPVDVETWTFQINPSETGLPSRDLGVGEFNPTAPDGVPTLYAPASEKAQQRTFKGIVVTKDERDRINLWIDKKRPVRLTEDDGDVSWLLFDKLDMTRKNVIKTNRRVAGQLVDTKIEYDLHAYVLPTP